jgi:hypothetical protein
MERTGADAAQTPTEGTFREETIGEEGTRKISTILPPSLSLSLCPGHQLRVITSTHTHSVPSSSSSRIFFLFCSVSLSFFLHTLYM